MSLFSKVNDYNLKLEKVLDSKYFSSNIKSLLQEQKKWDKMFMR